MSNREVFEVEVRHEGLQRIRQIRGTDKAEIDAKAKAQYAAWEQIWQRRQNLLKKHPEANKKEFTEQRNRELRLIWDQMNALLRSAIEKPHSVLWETLKDHRDFPKPTPKKPNQPTPPREPLIRDDCFQPKFRFLDRLFRDRRFKKIEQASQRFKQEHRQWDVKRKEILSQYAESQKQYEIDFRRWTEEKREFQLHQQTRNLSLDHCRDAYLKKTSAGIIGFCKLVLEASKYPKCFPRKMDFDYQAEIKTLTVKYQMPTLDDLPKVKELHYDQLRDDIRETVIPVETLTKYYERLIYQMCLRILYELYEADILGTLDSIVLHGWVESSENPEQESDRHEIVFLQAGRREFFGLNLRELDPKDCLRKLRAEIHSEALLVGSP
jgi:restriction system protein